MARQRVTLGETLTCPKCRNPRRIAVNLDWTLRKHAAGDGTTCHGPDSNVVMMGLLVRYDLEPGYARHVAERAERVQREQGGLW